ncbi:MAG: hypothetical protein EZS28_005915 [Streblomastix strix]|uniref:RNase H type-1 domain-containing protein n=1 Tax=Streblomastix strix TaxID=222440 RepID=A0A5J4WUS5_9EUKA|nr:MAG: hypothetical protein EZS28_005915 [Streblomastix strix]
MSCSPALCKLVYQILEFLENLKIQFSTFTIPGKNNREAESLSRLSTSGDYDILKEILSEALQELSISPTIDFSPNGMNCKCRRFYSLIWDQWVQGQDEMKANWKNETPLLYPPMLLIQRVLNKVMKDQNKAVMIVTH